MAQRMWMAGFLEGEGCFTWANGTPMVKAKQVSPNPLLILYYYLGGTIGRRRADGTSRACFEWQVCGSNARNCCRQLIDFLEEKRRQAVILLIVSKYKPHSQQREKLIKKLKDLKWLKSAH